MFKPLLLALAFVSQPAPVDWIAVAEKTKESIVFVKSDAGTCSGFVIDSNAKGDMDRILTDAHCYGPMLFADYMAARVVWKHDEQDLMVLEVPDTGRPALRLAASNPKVGEPIGSYGFGMGLEEPMFRTARVSIAQIRIAELEGGPFVMIDAAYVGGQSGGACVNAAGEVVSIVQRASGLVGIGVGAELIKQKAGRFFEKVKP